MWWFALGIAPAFAGDLTLAQALDQALRSNLEGRSARMDLDAAEAALSGARGGFDPTLSLGLDASGAQSLSNSTLDVAELTSTTTGWSAGVSQALPAGGSASLGWSESYSSSNSSQQVLSTTTTAGVWLSVDQPLLDGAGLLAARYGVRSALLGLDDAELAWRQAAESLVLEVSGAYWGLVAAGEGLRLATRSLEIAEGQLTDTLERVEEGFAGSGDVLQVERTVGVARQALVVAQADLEAAEAGLARLIGEGIVGRGALIPLDLPVVPSPVLDVNASLALARGRNAGWLRSKLGGERAELDFRAARNGALPDLGLTGSVQLSGGPDSTPEARGQVLDGLYPRWALGADLRVAVPYRTERADYQRARIGRDQAALSLEAAEQDLALSVEAAVRALKRDLSRLELAEQTLEAARLALEADQELLDEGRGSTRDVLLSLESLDEAQVGKLAAEIDVQTSALELMQVEGRLLEALAISVD